MAEMSLASLGQKLAQTWPARMARDAWGAVTLPGDVYQGNVSMYGDDGRTNPEVINRSMDLAGLVTGGSYAAPAMKDASGMGIRAYHGSPHDFDRFDLSKIGTGEGAQAYGHGLYFAEAEPVAKGYRDQLTRGVYKTDNGLFDPFSRANQAGLEHVNVRVSAGKGIDEGIARARELLEKQPFNAEMLNRDLAKLTAAKEAGAVPNPGHMYEVNINADPAKFLDWDKPLKAQTDDVQDALFMRLLDKMPRKKAAEELDLLQNRTGDSLYRNMSLNPREATNALREVDIPGIKYLDQGSRLPDPSIQHNLAKAKSGLIGAERHGDPDWIAKSAAEVKKWEDMLKADRTSNYVVFDDKLIDIMRKYGLAGLAPLAGYGAMQQGQQPSPQM